MNVTMSPKSANIANSIDNLCENSLKFVKIIKRSSLFSEIDFNPNKTQARHKEPKHILTF